MGVPVVKVGSSRGRSFQTQSRRDLESDKTTVERRSQKGQDRRHRGTTLTIKVL